MILILSEFSNLQVRKLPQLVLKCPMASLNQHILIFTAVTKQNTREWHFNAIKELYAYLSYSKVFALWYRVTEVLLIQILQQNQCTLVSTELLWGNYFSLSSFLTLTILLDHFAPRFAKTVVLTLLVVCQRLEIITYYSTVRAWSYFSSYYFLSRNYFQLDLSPDLA